ncbi:MAG TPA: hypothetical protein VGA03_10745 [Anaerolineales bacterium]|jgi:hypothetical protein
MAELVECHSGSEYAERPTALYWQGQRLEIEAVQRRWRTPAARCFRVRTVQDQIFELCYEEHSDRWQITPVGLGDQTEGPSQQAGNGL